MIPTGTRLVADILPVLSDNYIWLVHEEGSHDYAVIDPAQAGPVCAFLGARGGRLKHILNTHHHDDHIGGNLALKEETGSDIYGYGPDAARIPGIDHRLHDGETFDLFGREVRVMYMPGHTLGHIVYYIPAEKMLFCGDTVFAMGCGRLFEGNAAQMRHNFERFAGLPEDTRLYPAHEYTEKNARFALTVEPENAALQIRMREVSELRKEGMPTLPTTIGLEKATNPFFRTASVEEFADIRKRRDRY